MDDVVVGVVVLEVIGSTVDVVVGLLVDGSIVDVVVGLVVDGSTVDVVVGVVVLEVVGSTEVVVLKVVGDNVFPSSSEFRGTTHSQEHRLFESNFNAKEISAYTAYRSS